VKASEYISKRPYRVTAYDGIKLEDAQSEVFYALGPPTHVVLPAVTDPKGPWDKYREALEASKLPEGKSVNDYAYWWFEQTDKRLEVEFDRPGGRAAMISCYSKVSWKCPDLFGLSVGDSEDEVRARLGTPATETLTGTSKALRYPAYNFTAYLEMRRLYWLRVSADAAEVGD
jgi:hypothetical protein